MEKNIRRGDVIMAIRTILYGYDVENGKTVINIQESEIVKKVFSLYAEGKTLSDIALMLTDHNVIYFRNEYSCAIK